MDGIDHSRLMAKNKIRWMEFKPSEKQLNEDIVFIQKLDE